MSSHSELCYLLKMSMSIILMRRITNRKAGEDMRKTKRIPETIALAICLCLLLVAWTPVYAQEYLVEKGDTLWDISKNFNVSIAEIQEVNSIDGELILAGETLDVPEVSQAQTFSVSDEEIDLLARAVYSEARGEPFQGQVAIAAVILNRVDHGDFPDTINDVIFQPWAFTAVHDGQFWLTPDSTAYQAVREALAGEDPTDGAIYYYNPVTATNQWIRSRTIITSIGKHVFAL